MANFVLVHGAAHGAWCWSRVLPVLRAKGHEVVAVDPAIDVPAGSIIPIVGLISLISLLSIEVTSKYVLAVAELLIGVRTAPVD